MDWSQWIAGGTGLLAGLLLGAAFAWQKAQRQAAQRHQRLQAAAKEQLVLSTQKLRAANAKLQADLEKERGSVQAQLGSVAAERRATVARLELQLRFAYEEVDRLNALIKGGAVDSHADSGTDGSGFALTRPFAR